MKAMQFWGEAALFLLGWLLSYAASVANSFVLLDLAGLMLGLAGIFRLFKVITQPEKFWSVCNILAGAGLATYCLGEFLTLIQYAPGDAQEALLLGASFPSKAFAATNYLGLYYWFLVWLGGMEAKWWLPAVLKIKNVGLRATDPNLEFIILIYLVAVGFSQVVLIATGIWTFQGMNTTSGQLPLFPATVQALAEPIPAIVGWVIGRSKLYSRLFLPAIFSGVCQIVWLGALGRRAIIFGFLIFLICYFWGRPKRTVTSVILWSVPIFGIVYLAAALFLLTRYISTSSKGTDIPDLPYLIGQSFDIMTKDSSLVRKIQVENYSSRFFILQYLTLVADTLNLSSAKYGLYLGIAFLANVPRLLFSGKTELFTKNGWFADGKDHINAAIGLPIVDSNFSPFVQGFADFLWIGAIIYPLIFLAIGWICARLVRQSDSQILIIGGMGICFLHYIEIETTTGTLIGTIRPLLFLWLISKLTMLTRPSPYGVPTSRT